jgi:muramoyltetrapeptide carboxypeptidase
MKTIFPANLKKGDEIRIIAPARSLTIVSKDNQKLAIKKLEELGFKVTFGKNVNESDDFRSSSIESRIEDLHEAFRDKNVKGIFAVIGGFNSNQLLKYIDYDLIKNNPKVFCGYSDITALQNAIFAKTGLVTYSGPAFSSFAMKKGFDFNLDYFKKSLMSNDKFEVIHSKEWSDDAWYKDQDNREFIKDEDYWIINEGKAQGTIVGANLCTFNLLQGTEFMPSMKDSILFIEDDSESKAVNFDRDLQSLIHLPEFSGVKGIVIGRFQKDSEVTESLVRQMIKSKKELKNIPVIANADFGHTNPMITFPIGGTASIEVKEGFAELILIKH